MRKNCPKCGYQMSWNAKRCLGCGWKTERCTVCSHRLEDGKFSTWLMGGKDVWLCDDCFEVIGKNWVLKVGSKKVLAFIKESMKIEAEIKE